MPFLPYLVSFAVGAASGYLFAGRAEAREARRPPEVVRVPPARVRRWDEDEDGYRKIEPGGPYDFDPDAFVEWELEQAPRTLGPRRQLSVPPPPRR